MKHCLNIFVYSFTIIFLAGCAGITPEAESSEDISEQTIETRQKFFGKEHVDQDTGEISKDKVILSWFGVSNFAAAINGHVILLNTWIPGGEESDYVPAIPDELAALDPEAVFIGHAHFDHSDNAAMILEETDAVLVGSPEHCSIIKAEAEDESNIECIHAIGEDASPGDMGEIDLFEGVGITALAHVHSGLELPDKEDVAEPIHPEKEKENPDTGNIGDLLGAIGDEEGGTLLYQFQVGDFVLTWNDSAGPIKEEAPELFNVLESLPATDVQFGAIMGFNQYTNGLRDARMYMEALQPKLMVPTHHDNWSPPVTTNGIHYKGFLEEEMANIPQAIRPELLFISDPDDYLKPEIFTFDINDPKWQD